MSDYCESKSLEATGMEKLSVYESVSRESIGLQIFEVILDKSQHVYYPGQVITGKVRLEKNSPINAMGLKLECKGEGHVYFTNRSTGFRKKVSTQEIYFSKEIYLTENTTDAEIKSDVFSFSITLPENLPCSFEGRYGRVRYSIKSTLEITKDSQISSEPLSFTVAPVLDLNQHSLAPLPISETNAKTFTGHVHPLTMSVFLPVRGFVPGQTVPLKITLKNESKVNVKKLRIVFKKVVVYHSSDNIRKHKEIVVEIEKPVERNCQLYTDEFDVPSIPPSGEICNLIDVSYTLKIEACVDINEWYYRMFHKNLKIRTSIIIGSVPLNNYEDPMEFSDDNSKSGETVPLNGLKYHTSRIYRSSKPERDDPVGEDGGEDAGIMPYSPMYRVYKFQSLKDKKNCA